MDLFKEFHQAGKTIILITHEPEIAALCQRTITLRDGQIISDEQNEVR